MRLVFEKKNSTFYGISTDEAKAAEHQSTLEEKLKVYDVILSKQKYVAGDVSNQFQAVP